MCILVTVLRPEALSSAFMGQILEKKKSIEKLKDVISMDASELSEVQIALNEAKLREENVKSECHRVQEENARLKKKKEQVRPVLLIGDGVSSQRSFLGPAKERK